MKYLTRFQFTTALVDWGKHKVTIMKKNETTPANVSRETFSTTAVLIGETAIPTGIVTKDINGKSVQCFESSFDMGGQTTTITCYDERLAKDLSVLLVSSNVDSIIGLRKAIACYNLKKDDNWKLVSGDFKSFGDMSEKMFNIKRDTAVSYARVAEYFLTFENDTVGYKSELYNGASLANMLQLLGMVDDDSAEPMKWIDKYILKGMLHITASLSKLKSDIDDVKSDVEYGGKNKKSGKKSDGKGAKKPDKGQTPEKSTSELLQEVMERISKIEDDEKRDKANKMIQQLGELILG